MHTARLLINIPLTSFYVSFTKIRARIGILPKNKMRQITALLIISINLFAATSASGQLEVPELSVPGKLEQRVGFTTITITYERPSARGRTEQEIFGKLVPFGKRWRTGAGNGTRIRFDTDVVIGNKPLKKGFYTFFSIPQPDKWTIIFNADTSDYSSSSHQEKDDAVRFDVAVSRTSRFYEALTYDIDIIPNNGRIFISWLNTQVSFDVMTGADEQVISFVKKHLLTGENNDVENYHRAVTYYEWHNKDPKDLMYLIDKGILLKNERTWYYGKVKLLEKQGKYREAIMAANSAIRVIQESSEGEGSYKADLLADFQKWIVKLEEKKSLK
jgi:hypothetical protein